MKRFMGIFLKLMLITCPLAYRLKLQVFGLDFSIDFILRLINEKELLYVVAQNVSNGDEVCRTCVCVVQFFR